MGVPSCPCLQFTAAVRQLEEEREGLGHEPPAPPTKDRRGQSCRMKRANLESRKSPKPKSKGFGKSLDRSLSPLKRPEWRWCSRPQRDPATQSFLPTTAFFLSPDATGTRCWARASTSCWRAAPILR